MYNHEILNILLKLSYKMELIIHPTLWANTFPRYVIARSVVWTLADLGAIFAIVSA